MVDPKTALEDLYARGITTLEQLVESKAKMRKSQRIDSQRALDEISERSATEGSFRSQIGPPAPSVPIVLDGKRVDYSEIARFNGKPLDYVATTVGSGEQALVVFSDRSIMRNHDQRALSGSLRAITSEVDNALRAGGLQPVSISRINLGLRMWDDVNYGGGAWTLAPEEYVEDLSDFDEGLGLFGGDWNDKISSVEMARCYMRAWEHAGEGGASLTLYRDNPNLHAIGWGDRISSIWAPFSN